MWLMVFLLHQTFDPKKRITVEDALAHPYLEAYVRILLQISVAQGSCKFSSWHSYPVLPACVLRFAYVTARS